MAIDMSIIKEKPGLVVRKDVLCDFLRKQKYHSYCFILGNKEVRADNKMVINGKDLSGCMMMDEKGEWNIVQKLRVI